MNTLILLLFITTFIAGWHLFGIWISIYALLAIGCSTASILWFLEKLEAGIIARRQEDRSTLECTYKMVAALETAIRLNEQFLKTVIYDLEKAISKSEESLKAAIYSPKTTAPEAQCIREAVIRLDWEKSQRDKETGERLAQREAEHQRWAEERKALDA